MLAGLSFLAGPSSVGDEIARARPRTVMQYLGDRALHMAAALPPLPNALAEWEKRRVTVRRGLTQLLGLPPREPMRAKVLAGHEDGDLLVEDVAYLWGERAYVSAHIVRPRKPTGTLPAIVVPPGWLGELEQEWYKTFVYRMARGGYLLLFIDDPHVGRRGSLRRALRDGRGCRHAGDGHPGLRHAPRLRTTS